jgi:hypothetical protein
MEPDQQTTGKLAAVSSTPWLAACFAIAGMTLSVATFIPLLTSEDWHANATLWMLSAICYSIANGINAYRAANVQAEPRGDRRQ